MCSSGLSKDCLPIDFLSLQCNLYILEQPLKIYKINVLRLKCIFILLNFLLCYYHTNNIKRVAISVRETTAVYYIFDLNYTYIRNNLNTGVFHYSVAILQYVFPSTAPKHSYFVKLMFSFTYPCVFCFVFL